MNPASVREDIVVQEILIKRPAEKIFAALTRPEELLKWWRVEGKFEATKVECDLRPGGKWRMEMHGGCAGGSNSVVVGEYREIERPWLLVFTWVREQEDGIETLVRWDLEEKDEGLTFVRVTHTGLTSEALRTRNNGWPMIMGLLKGYAEEAK
jgi:uncharacterized protein YndB with AHSA1/START domain